MPALAATDVVVQPAARLGGRLTCPGDKSISHRYALLAALATGRTTITGYASGADCASTLNCLRALGVQIAQPGDGLVEIEGRGLGGLAPPTAPLDAGNSGTTFRLLAGILAAQPFDSTLTGDDSLRRRPMERIIAPLRAMGATLHADDDRPPLTISGGSLRGVEWAPPVPSAQVKSAVLLAGLHASGATTVRESAATRDHTERALSGFGIDVERLGLTVTVRGGTPLTGRAVQVPGDFSSAAAWAIAAAASDGSHVVVADVGMNPTRTALLDVLRRAGATVTTEIDRAAESEPIGRLTVAHRSLRPVVIEPSEVPALIDELPLLAALGTYPGAALTVTGAAELRAKESDRIAALVAGLRGLGATASELPDGFTITGGAVSGGTADAAGDHRLVMAFAVAALGAKRPSTILGADAVTVSYPDFFETLTSLRA
ncbi:MAG: 3-phosphoshikimate 1-carboxyvinyltransferase [Vicinamibacterales bacterium]|jgi:3-phosphoshikimate 1-carboxyvinyltransferase|nr:3-phosphoshikimate 1-carboxyvinyltransferase [Acidobacteriota bacterium]MDP7294152.1 3-phosphoshikimate 1-carboxyvinyltransferase [Vicinamibacterales bacterium]MDP7472713.1 3-phosphoshikimate 1-carboxyvinyltransferase [Vicinamibacterales bacterium]MDP7671593.1 3-phosphoshikimate 1-carboxyvinyltransferase [Vicinamibacterales bacterium]HJO38595.1 3-phosphoshikimate 1-carboxyvinyltransferase [Vicinamibacterales bacterium]